MGRNGHKVRIGKLGEFRPQSANANAHTERGLGLLDAAMSEDGYVAPMTATADGEVIDGSARLERAYERFDGEAIVVEHDGTRPVIAVRTDIPSADSSLARRISLRANRIAEVDLAWNPEVLASIAEVDPDVLKGTFTDKELAEILSQTGVEPKDAEPQVDKAEALREKWGVEAGQLWLIGSHRLLCGDATKKEDVERLCGSSRINLVVTSPPYNQRIDGFKPSGMHTETKWVKNMQEGGYDDSKPESEYQAEQAKALAVWSEFLSSDASVFYNHKNRYRDKQVISPWRWVEAAGAKVRQEIIWKREGSVTQNARMFLPCDERIFWLYFGADFYFDDSTEIKTWSSVWEINSHKDIGHSEHGCAFPVDLPSRCIRACSRVGDIVLEPYAGSGTTLVAAENLNRKCYAMEISPAYVAVCLERMATAFPHLRIERVNG